MTTVFTATRAAVIGAGEVHEAVFDFRALRAIMPS